MPDRLTRPAHRPDFLRVRPIWHTQCGAKLCVITDYDDPDESDFNCSKCGLSFPLRYLDRLGAQGIADRFHVEVVPDWSTDVLVYVVDHVTGSRYAALRPLREAEGLERVRI